MSDNRSSGFSWLGQLQELYDNSANSVLKSVLDSASYHLNNLNPEAPKAQTKKAETFNSIAPTAQTNNFIPKEPNSNRIQKEAIYDKVFNDFINNYKTITKAFPHNPSGHEEFDDQKLRGEFNSLLIKEFNENNPTNNLKKLTETENSIASLAFSTTVIRLLERKIFSENHRASRGEFELLLTNQQELHAIIAKKYLDKYPNAFSDFDEQDSLKNKNQNPKPEAPNADCPNAFSVVKDYLFIATSTATTFLTNTVSFVVSFMFDSNKAPNSQSNQDSVQQKTATMPTGNQTPTTAPELGEYKTRTEDPYKDTPSQWRSSIGLNSSSNSPRSH